MKQIAIQGGVGAYHNIAAEHFFENEEIKIIPCVTFKKLFEKVQTDANIIGIMAIENTIAGSILPNYELLRKSNLLIAGEYKLRIEHCLAALPNQTLTDIVEITSHPMALMQCEEYLDTLNNIKIVEHEDTALAAKDIFEKQLKHHAAICSHRAAEIYSLQILNKGIETNKHNFTRFLIISNKNQIKNLQKNKPINKASIAFALPHIEGSLSKILSIFSFYDISLTKIQSLPIVGREWEYRFYIDLKFNDIKRYKQALAAIEPLTKELELLGEYPDGKQSIR